jgi:hypothetical protein
MNPSTTAGTITSAATINIPPITTKPVSIIVPPANLKGNYHGLSAHDIHLFTKYRGNASMDSILLRVPPRSTRPAPERCSTAAGYAVGEAPAIQFQFRGVPFAAERLATPSCRAMGLCEQMK